MRRPAAVVVAAAGRHSPLVCCAWLLLLSLVTTSLGQADECLFTYTKQPPHEPMCSFGEDLLTVLCEATGPTASVVIKWWLRNSTDFIREIPTDTTTVITTNNSFVYSSQLELDPTSSEEGFYVCRIEVNGVVGNESDTQLDYNSLIDIGFTSPCTGTVYSNPSTACALYQLPSPPGPVDTPIPTPSPLATSVPSLPSSSSSSTSSPSSTPMGSPSGSSDDPSSTPPPPATLQVWLYVVVAVAAVFAVIIVVMAILCVGLCLRRSHNQTGNSYKPEDVEKAGLPFASSMVSNGLYQGGNASLQGSPAPELPPPLGRAPTLPPLPPQPSAYSTLGTAEYEVIDFQRTNHCPDYHHLQRPSVSTITSPTVRMPPDPTQRRNTAIVGGSVPWSPSLVDSMSGGSAITLPVFDNANNSVKYHIYKTLESGDELARSSCASSSPGTPSAFDRAHSAQSSVVPTRDQDWGRANESLYQEGGLSNPMYPFGLERVPETGSIFDEPPNPTSFPVTVYEDVPVVTASYETPVISKKDSPVPSDQPGILPLSTVGAPSETATTSDDVTGKSTPDYTLDTTSENTEIDGELVEGFAVRDSGTYSSDSSSCYPKDYTFSSEAYIPSGGIDSDGEEADSNQRRNTIECVFAPSSPAVPSAKAGLAARKSNTTDCAFRVSVTEQENGADETADSTTHEAMTLPLRRPGDEPTPRTHAYKLLEIGSIDPKVKYTKLEIGRNTAV